MYQHGFAIITSCLGKINDKFPSMPEIKEWTTKLKGESSDMKLRFPTNPIYLILIMLVCSAIACGVLIWLQWFMYR
jgi:hypothetical protein